MTAPEALARILVIDRTEELDGLESVGLAELGAEIATATDGEAGVRAAHLYRPDLVLLGVHLPDRSGFDVCRQLKDDPRTRGIPVVFVTGENNPDSKVRGFEVGAVDYVTKPYHPAELRARVKIALQTRAMVETLAHQARIDALTGLPNRVLLCERLTQAIERTKGNPNYRFAVLFLDLDRFKIVNDSLGHEAGDRLLEAIAKRIQLSIRAGDTAARVGGDEFVIVLDNVDGIEQVERISRNLQERLSAPYELGGHEVTSTASIGIVTSDARYDRADDVLRDADTAMFRAKNAGKAHHVVFDEAMHRDVVRRLRLEQELRAAVERVEFVLEYQPIHSLESGGLVGFEALLRWSQEDRGHVTRPEYIPLAEEIGLIVPLGRWALFEATRLLRKWQSTYPLAPPLTMNVNVSKRQLMRPGFVETVREVLADTRPEPRSLKLEITESVIMDHLDELTPVLQELRALNVQLCLDDFGTGHSSLSCLHKFPVDVIKIDREFLMNMDENRQYAAVTHAIVTLAHNLGMDVVAEGVETLGQLAQLQALECDYAQGYYFSRAMSREAAELFIRKPHRLERAV